ncbi:MAG TPA: hypothetical protein VGE52_21855, partial [Pirellulales bacterium]
FYGGCLSLAAIAVGWGIRAYGQMAEVPEGHERIQYSHLKKDASSGIASEAQMWNGKKVFIDGYVYARNELVGVTKFILCPDNGKQPYTPRLSEMIEVTLAQPIGSTFQAYRLKVYGTFRYEPTTQQVNGHSRLVLYHIDDASFME